jgi:hypothetical protein
MFMLLAAHTARVGSAVRPEPPDALSKSSSLISNFTPGFLDTPEVLPEDGLALWGFVVLSREAMNHLLKVSGLSKRPNRTTQMAGMPERWKRNWAVSISFAEHAVDPDYFLGNWSHGNP